VLWFYILLYFLAHKVLEMLNFEFRVCIPACSITGGTKTSYECYRFSLSSLEFETKIQDISICSFCFCIIQFLYIFLVYRLMTVVPFLHFSNYLGYCQYANTLLYHKIIFFDKISVIVCHTRQKF
jgi:hypothetical protein